MHPILSGLSDDDRAAVMARVQRRSLRPGEVLVEEGAEDPSVILVEDGRLEVHSGGTLLGTVERGDLLGEMALFAGGTRSAWVTATEPCHVLVLDWDAYDALRRSGHSLASVLEQQGLRRLAERLSAVRLQIAAMVVGPGRPLPSYQTGWVDCATSLLGAMGLGPAAVPDGAAGLARSALFTGVGADVLQELARHLGRSVWPRGRVLFGQGDDATTVYLAASGRVDLFRSAPGGGVWPLGSVLAGQAFGMTPLAAGHPTRDLVAVVRRRLVAWTLDAEVWRALVDRADDVGSGFRVAMIRALAEQLTTANQQLANLDQDDAELARRARATGENAW